MEVLEESDKNIVSESFERLFIYGNYIDEVLIMDDGTDAYYDVHC